MNVRIPVSMMLALLVIGCSGGKDEHTAVRADAAVTKAGEQGPAGEARDLSFPISCSGESQAAFNTGLFLLHNMMYKQAQAEFESAVASDDACAMLHWGIAMTQFHPKWPGDPTEQALRTGGRAVEQARSIAARVSTTTDRENGHIEAVGAYYEDWQGTDRDARRSRWRDAYGDLAGKHPEDYEAQIFFALGRLVTSAPSDFEAQLRAAEGLEVIFRKKPEHPGVLHYLLHAYDNPAYARRGVKVAEAYEAVAPNAPHALHMPSHIYVRLGDWEKVIDWNIRSRNAAEAQPVDDGRVSRHFLHALDYLVYAYLQIGDDGKARQEAARIDAEVRWQLESGPGAYALAAAPARFAIERRAWQEAAGLKPRAIPYTWDGYPWAEAITYAARGLGAVRSGDVIAARESMEALDRLEGLTSDGWWRGRIDIQRDVIAGWIAHEQSRIRHAIELLRRAADRELAAGKQSVEPGHVINAVEQLGELLLESGRPEEALEVFERSLKESPGRLHSLAGAGKAAEEAGMDEEATAYYTELVEMVAIASNRSEVARASDFLTRANNQVSGRGAPAGADYTTHSDVVVIEGTTLVNGRSGSQTNVTIVSEGGRITYVGARPDRLPDDARVLDGADRFVIPGLIDVHVHDGSEAYLRRMLGWGVTSVHLMPRSLPERPVAMEHRSRLAETPMPRLQITPMFAWAFPDNLVPDTYEFLKPGTPDEARKAVRELHSQGYRQIKIIQDDSTLWAGEEHRSPLPPEPVFEALIKEARANDMRIYVHATQLDVARIAMASGIDAFMHGIMDEQLASEDWRAMQEAGMSWTPTLNALFLFGDQRRYARRLLANSRFLVVAGRKRLAELRAHASADKPIIPPKMDALVAHTDAYVETIAQNTQRALLLDVPVAVGSDGGPSGLSTQLEMELLQENGMSPTAVLTAATYGGAVTMGWDNEVGSVEIGKLADLVVLEADPSVDIRNCRRIAWVIKGGRPYAPETLFTEAI